MLWILVLLMVIFALGGGSYHHWGTAGPAWGGNVLYLLAVLVLLFALVSFFAPGRFVL